MVQSRRLVEVRVPGTFSNRLRLFAVSSRACLQKARLRFHSSSLYRWRYSGSVPERLLIAPPDLHTSDPTVGDELIQGTFVFAGHVVSTGGSSPFEIIPPSVEWLQELNEFGWLRHLRNTDNPDAKLRAHGLVEDWINLNGKWSVLAWRPDIVCTRVFAWLAHSPVILQGSSQEFYHLFLKSLNRQIRYLRRIVADLPPGLLRLKIAIALAVATLSISDQKRFTRSSARRLDEELNMQVFPDGGHISRSPAAVVEILTTLLPLRQAFIARGLEPTKAIIRSVDRMMPMLRFFRHCDGAFAHFNGMGGTKSDLIATLLAYDDARGKPVTQAKYSGYSRLEAGDSVLIADTGRPAPLRISQEAHAGCLSFEFSHNGQRIITNCGAPAAHLTDWRQITRATAAHSALTINDTSSCRFLREGAASQWLGPVIISGPENVRVSQFENERGQELVMSHDGYAASFGLVHERTLILERDGKSLFGIDTLTGHPIEGFDDYAIRFHIHPNAITNMAPEGKSAFLKLPNGDTWEFEATPGADIELEESIYMSETMGYRRSSQIVIYGLASQMNSVTWSFVKTGSPRSRPLSERDMAQAFQPEETADNGVSVSQNGDEAPPVS